MAELDATSLVIEDQPQFFFDDGIVESVQNLTRVIHRPEKVEANPLIEKDKPWEHLVYFGTADFALWRDAESGQFRCLYSDWKFDRARHAAKGGSIMAWDYMQDTHLYACSDDGLTWEKPAMGLIEVDGRDTNGVFGGAGYGSVWNMTVLDDPLETDAARRYKAVHSFIPAGSPPEAADTRGSPGVFAWTGSFLYGPMRSARECWTRSPSSRPTISSLSTPHAETTVTSRSRSPTRTGRPCRAAVGMIATSSQETTFGIA